VNEEEEEEEGKENGREDEDGREEGERGMPPMEESSFWTSREWRRYLREGGRERGRKGGKVSRHLMLQHPNKKAKSLFL